MSKFSKYQTKLNILFNFLTFLVNAVLGVLLPPFLIRNLGIDVYGLIPISMSITSFMLLITISVNGTLSRFLSVDFEKKDNKANVTFSTAFFLIIGITIILLPLSFFFAAYADKFLSIPPRVLSDAKWMLIFVFISFFLNAFSAIFNSIAYVKNRTDLSNVAVIINRVLTLLVLALFFGLGFIRIQVYGIAVLIATMAALIYSYYTFKKLSPEININLTYFDRQQLKKISSLGFWIILSQVGVIFFLQTDILIVNYFKGAELSGLFATLLQWSFLIRVLTGIISGAIGPLVLNLYAKQEFDRLKQLTVFATKLLGLFTTSIVSVLVYFSEDILRVWLGDEYAVNNWLLNLIVIHLGVNLSVNAINNINLAYNKARIPSIVTLISGLLNISLGIILLLYTDLGLYGIAIAGLIALTIKSALFTPYYSARLMQVSMSTFYLPILPSLLLTGIVLTLAFIFPSSHLNIGSNLFLLILYAGIFSIILGLIIFRFVLNSQDKKALIGLVKSKSKL